MPEARAAVAVLEGPLEDHWRRALGVEIRRVVDAAAERRDEDAIGALLAALRIRAGAAFSRDLAARAAAASSALRAAGRTSVFGDLSPATPAGTFSGERGAAALHLLMHGRLLVHQDEIRRLLAAVVRGTVSRADAVAAVSRVLGLSEGSVGVRPIVDAWAYRELNTGAARAAIEEVRAGRARQIVAWNPRDGRTTPFCWWVHGREIGASKLARRLALFERAVDDGDIEAVIRAWPLIDLSNILSTNEFEAIELRVAAPPYHYFCRTQMRVV